MARPPRIPVLLSGDREVIYFLTICVHPRRPVLNNDQAWQAVGSTLARLDRWRILCLVLMPDHIHFLAAPLDRAESVSAFFRWFKRWFAESYPMDGKWQQGGFDRLLRNDENAQEKWIYIRENPVRSGLVEDWQQWPYQFGFDEHDL